MLLGLGQQAFAANRNPEDDLKALDMADAEVTDNLPKDIPHPPKPASKVKSAHTKAHKKVMAVHKKQNVSNPEATAKKSALWSHDNELTAEDDADKVLDEGDEEAHQRIEEIHEHEESKIAPARVHRVSQEEAAAAKKDKTDALDSVKTVVQDIKDLKAANVEKAREKAEVEREEKQEAEERKNAKKNHTKALTAKTPTQKKINLDKLMNLAKVAKANALGSPRTQLVQEVDEPKTIAAKAFKGPPVKDEVKKQTQDLHSTMARRIASMHTALHETVKTQNEAAQYEQNKAAEASKAQAELEKAQAEAEAQKKKEQSEKYQAALKVSQETAKVEAEQRAVAKAKVADYRAAQRKLREAKAQEQAPVLVKPMVAVQSTPEMRSDAWASAGLASATLAVTMQWFL